METSYCATVLTTHVPVGFVATPEFGQNATPVCRLLARDGSKLSRFQVLDKLVVYASMSVQGSFILGNLL